MIICPNCLHHNTDGAATCEVCQAALPSTSSCPNCGASTQLGAQFCGQCGFNLTAVPNEEVSNELDEIIALTAEKSEPEKSSSDNPFISPNPHPPDPWVMPDLMPQEHTAKSHSSCPNCGASTQLGALFCGQCGFNLTAVPNEEVSNKLDGIIALTAEKSEPEKSSSDNPFISPNPHPPDPGVMPDLMLQEPTAESPMSAALPSISRELPQVEPLLTPSPAYPDPSSSDNPSTQLQQQRIQLVHVQTNTVIDLPPTLELIHMGKPNDRVPPNVDVSGFPNAEVVSRIHADIHVEEGHYFIEDAGSTNGTYINSIPLLPGNRHHLRIGDQIALGKGNLVTFLFQLN